MARRRPTHSLYNFLKRRVNSSLMGPNTKTEDKIIILNFTFLLIRREVFPRIQSEMFSSSLCSFVSVVPRCVNFATFSDDSLVSVSRVLVTRHEHSQPDSSVAPPLPPPPQHLITAQMFPVLHCFDLPPLLLYRHKLRRTVAPWRGLTALNFLCICLQTSLLTLN
jgi:hypothetical protein